MYLGKSRASLPSTRCENFRISSPKFTDVVINSRRNSLWGIVAQKTLFYFPEAKRKNNKYFFFSHGEIFVYRERIKNAFSLSLSAASRAAAKYHLFRETLDVVVWLEARLTWNIYNRHSQPLSCVIIYNSSRELLDEKKKKNCIVAIKL